MGYKVGSALVITLMSRPFDPSATLPSITEMIFSKGESFEDKA